MRDTIAPLLTWSPWFSLDSLPRTLLYEHRGVYVIIDSRSYAVRVGQGNIRDRLHDHSNDPDIRRVAGTYPRVSWARVEPDSLLTPIEAAIAHQLRPAIGEYPAPKRNLFVKAPPGALRRPDSLA